tara:strand:+ start:285 stop:440 length:156 start_codon:yes stop_codon:yes gene_type:complete
MKEDDKMIERINVALSLLKRFIDIMEEEKDGSITIEQQVSDLYMDCKKNGL